MFLLLVLTGLVTYYTGPAGRESLERRRALLDRPTARVMYLPSSSCRGPGIQDS